MNFFQQLSFPLGFESGERPGGRDSSRLPPTQERVNDVRRQQRQPWHSRDVDRVDLLRRGELVTGGEAPGHEHPPPPERTDDRVAQPNIERALHRQHTGL